MNGTKPLTMIVDDLKNWECFECITCTFDTQNKCRNPHNSISSHKQKKVNKPQTGDLLIDGIMYRENQPFALLQDIKRRKVLEGVDKSRIKITYTKIK